MSEPTTGKRHECLLRDNPDAGYRHVSGTGAPKRKRCVCGGSFIVRVGWWGVFRWRGDGRYPRERALSLHTRESAAEAVSRKVDPSGDTVCVRWVDAR